MTTLLLPFAAAGSARWPNAKAEVQAEIHGARTQEFVSGPRVDARAPNDPRSGARSKLEPLHVSPRSKPGVEFRVRVLAEAPHARGRSHCGRDGEGHY